MQAVDEIILILFIRNKDTAQILYDFLCSNLIGKCVKLVSIFY